MAPFHIMDLFDDVDVDDKLTPLNNCTLTYLMNTHRSNIHTSGENKCLT